MVDAAKFTHPATMTASDSARAKFERLLEEHAGIVRKIAFGYARTESDRRDLMQEIALQLWRAYPRYSPERPFSTWMYRIALNVSISLLRRNTRPGRETVPFDELKHDSAHEQSSSPEGRANSDLAKADRSMSASRSSLLLLYLTTITLTAKSRLCWSNGDQCRDEIEQIKGTSSSETN